MNDHNGQLKAIVERIEAEETRKAEAAENVREIYAEARSNGYDPAALRVLVKERREDMDKRKRRQTREELVEVYRNALGLLADLPLGVSALARVS